MAEGSVTVTVGADGRDYPVELGALATGLAAPRVGRRSVGVDLSAKYLDQAVQKMSSVPLPLGIVS